MNIDEKERTALHLRGRIRSISAIDHARRDQMFALMGESYEALDREQFDRDLDEKHWVLEVYELATDQLFGFSTQRLIEVEVGGRDVGCLFSGDTVVARQAWNHPLLPLVWGRFAFQLMHACQPQPVYWFLITKGYRTYRYLPVYFRSFYPRFDRATPDWERTLIDRLGQLKYPENYDRERRVIRAGRTGYRVRREVGEIADLRLKDPHLRFFLEANPGCAQGDELCCVAPLHADNWSPAALRLIHSPRFQQQVDDEAGIPA